ncbi:MAG TPA: TetR/AcrR family transcriptional regulator [Plasticicumulans sp.]|nr:TetR/AcrR family transcriptional regulator [Plasticicumulans sp.]
MNPRPSSRPRGATRDELVHIGVRMLTEKGYGQTGLDEILRTAGVPRGSFYHYFPSKEAYGLAVVEHYAQYFAKRLARAFDDDSLTPLDRLRRFVTEACAGMIRHEFRRGCLVGNLGQELGAHNDAFRERLEAVLGHWQARVADCLRAAIRAGELPPETDAEALAGFFWIAWEGAILRAKLTRSTAPLALCARVFFTQLLHAAPPSLPD